MLLSFSRAAEMHYWSAPWPVRLNKRRRCWRRSAARCISSSASRQGTPTCFGDKRHWVVTNACIGLSGLQREACRTLRLTKIDVVKQQHMCFPANLSGTRTDSERVWGGGSRFQASRDRDGTRPSQRLQPWPCLHASRPSSATGRPVPAAKPLPAPSPALGTLQRRLLSETGKETTRNCTRPGKAHRLPAPSLDKPP